MYVHSPLKKIFAFRDLIDICIRLTILLFIFFVVQIYTHIHSIL
ncbi:hypothetical protein DOY81_004132, partial [Sarcophaga bullata]